MRKFLLALAVGLLAASLAAPAYAADFKYTGYFRVRGITSDDMDRNKLTHDGLQYYDSLVRPRFTSTSEGGKLWGIYELDLTDGNHIFGATGTGDQAVAVNRWLFDFAVPGTTLRMRVGRTDYTDPTNEIFDSIGVHRQDGAALYGKLFGPVDLSAFTTKLNDRAGAADATHGASDDDNYYVALKWTVSPNIALTPWVALSRRNTDNAAASTGYELYYLALHAQAKVGIMDLVVQAIFESGDAAQPTAARRLAGDRDVDMEAWAFMVRSWFTFGNLKLGAYLTVLTGDDDQVTATGNTQQQKDRRLSRFVFPTSSGYLEGPNILTGRRFSTITANQGGLAGSGNTTSNRTGTGDGRAAQLNGLIMPEILAKYQLTPTLGLEGNISFVRSHKKAPDVGATLTGAAAAATTYDNNKNFGTAFELGFRWNIYKELEMRAQASYLAVGDYGQVQGGVAKDDAWGIYYEFAYIW